MRISTKNTSFFADLICRSTSSCPRISPFPAKARFACGRFAGAAPLELTLPRSFPSHVVSRGICFVRSKHARTTSSSAPRFAAKRSTSASFSQHESSRQNQLLGPLFSQNTGSRARRTTRLALSFSPPSPLRKRAARPPSASRRWRLPVQVQYKCGTSTRLPALRG